MSKRAFYQFQGSLERGMVCLEGNIEIGASSQVVDDGEEDGYGSVGNFKGLTVRKNSDTGEYSLLLDNDYQRLVSYHFEVRGALTRDCRVTSVKWNGASAVTVLDEVVIQIVDKSGAAAALTSATIYGQLRLKNSRS